MLFAVPNIVLTIVLCAWLLVEMVNHFKFRLLPCLFLMALAFRNASIRYDSNNLQGTNVIL